MTIDERLERIAAMQMKNEEEQRKTQRSIRNLGRLVRVIVLDHEARLTDLEGGEHEKEGT